MKIAAIQMSVMEGDKRGAIAKAADGILSCRGVDLIVLPEIWNIGFTSFDRYVADAEDREGITLSTLRRLAREVGAHIHTGSFVETDGSHHYNSSYLLSPRGEIIGNYRKIHLFGYNSREKQILTPGNHISVVDTPMGKIGMATCYDLRFPELFRRMVDRGAILFTVCSAWPFARLQHWLLLNRVRALENQCFVVSANSAGWHRGSQYAGHSMISNPWGEVCASGGEDEGILRCELNPADVQTAREEFPALADRVNWLN